MSANYRDLLKYAATGIASPDMTYYDKMRASTLMCGAVQTLTGIPPLDFISKTDKTLISWSMLGNGQQTGTPSPQNIIMPTFCGVRTGNLAPPLEQWVDGYINKDDGSVSPQIEDRQEKSSAFIPVEGNTGYIYSYESGSFPTGSFGAWRAVALYDSNKKFIQRDGGEGDDPFRFTTTSGTAYVRLCLRTYGNNVNVALNASINLSPPLTNWVNGYINMQDGSLSPQNEDRQEKSSDFIPVKRLTSYTYCYPSGTFPTGTMGAWRAVALYDSNKQFIERIGGDGASEFDFTITGATAYIRLCFRTYGNDKNVILYDPSEFITYEPYGYKIPITCAGHTVPVYLGQVSTVRRVKKLVLTGNETIVFASEDANRLVGFFIIPGMGMKNSETGYCNILLWENSYPQSEYNRVVAISSTRFYLSLDKSILPEQTLDGFKAYLAAQYAAGTPVTIWYVLATEQTAIVNEPLAKIGDYADELHSEDAGVSIPTAKGQNTLTVETDLQPSEMAITGYIKESSPFPPDCPFECDLDYFIDDAIEWSIAERTYKKINTEYAVGAMIYIPPYHIGLLMSPVSAEAVAYTAIGRICYSAGSIDYNGKTWYYSSSDYAEIGETSGLPLYETPISYPYTQEQLTQFLQFINAKNR